MQVPLHVLDQLSRAERGAAQARRAHFFTASAVYAGIEVEELLPAEAVYSRHTEALERVGIALEDGLHVGMHELSAAAEVAQEDVQRAVEDVAELPMAQVADEDHRRALAVIQLCAVISVLRELRVVDRNADWVGPGQTLMEGIVGEGVMISAAEAQSKRPSTIAYDLAKLLLFKYFKDADGEPKLHLFWQIQRIARRWLDEGYLDCKGDTGKWMLEYLDVGSQAAERIYNAIVNSIGDKRKVKAVLDPYNPKSSTTHVGFSTTKDLWTTAKNKCHINYVVLDSDWEAEFARVAEQHPKVISYVKNQGLGLEIPYKDGSTARNYVPDFIVQIDDGHGQDDPLHLVVEVKGYRHENVKLKSETVRTQWVPGVNNLGSFGRWTFEEFNDVFEMDKEFKALIDKVLKEQSGNSLEEVGAA